MAIHTEYTLRGPRVTEILDLFLAVATFKTTSAKGLFTGYNGNVVNLGAARAAAISTVSAHEGTIADHEEIYVGIKVSAASMASEAVDVPSVSG